ncbi:C-3 sterol dehydrogenase/C-4 decarboxylase family protein [Tricladium varicosporioides]|nr:C-3 sterol dehydrogenase/C-4 decarboxylase family protein [Hymenoscyphus varicosporioides]
MATPSKQNKLGNVLVIGGCGFLGHHIVDLLLKRTISKVSVLDLSTTRNRRPNSDGVVYYDGDITSLESMLPIFQKVKPDVVIHTASPNLIGAQKELYYKVNVEGTKCVVEVCQKAGVKALVYTSSASIISDNNAMDLINADERWPVIPAAHQTEYYSQTKAEAEQFVLNANRSESYPNLLTLSIRPAGIFGEGDVQNIPNFLKVHYDNKTTFQLGDNTNLFDFTYVGNVAYAHILAAWALLQTSALKTKPLDTEKVDGEAFFITNCEPTPFWDYARAIWQAAGRYDGTEKNWVIGKDVGLALGGILEWVFWVVGREAKLTRKQVKYSCMTRYYDCTKARRRLGYVPIVSLRDGIQKTVDWFEEERKEGEKKVQ